MSAEEIIQEKIRLLTPDKQAEVINFIDFLTLKNSNLSLSKPSPQSSESLTQELNKETSSKHPVPCSEWPDGFFETVIGGWQGDDLIRAEQGNLEERLEMN